MKRRFRDPLLKVTLVVPCTFSAFMTGHSLNTSSCIRSGPTAARGRYLTDNAKSSHMKFNHIPDLIFRITSRLGCGPLKVRIFPAMFLAGFRAHDPLKKRRRHNKAARRNPRGRLSWFCIHASFFAGHCIEYRCFHLSRSCAAIFISRISRASKYRRLRAGVHQSGLSAVACISASTSPG